MATTADSVVVELEARTDQYNAKINQAAANFEKAAGKIENNSARIANAQRNIGRQVSDVGASLASGGNLFTIFAQQSGQVADALADTGGKAAKFAAFFAGPWGAALLAAGSLLGVLAGKALQTGESIDSLVKKLKDNADKAELAAQADRVFASTQEGLTVRIRELTKALDAQNDSLRTNAQLRNVQAKNAVEDSQRKLDQANKELAAARRNASAQGATGGVAGTAGFVAGQADKAAAAAADKLAQAQRNQRNAAQELQISRVHLAEEEAEANSTAAGRIGRAYDDRIRAIEREQVKLIKAGKDYDAATYTRIALLKKEKAAAIETANANEKAARASTRKSAKGRALGGTSERAIEAARVRDVRNNEAYNSDLEQLNREIFNAKRSQATDAGEIAEYARQEVAAELARKNNAIEADVAAKKYTAAQGEALKAKAQEVAALKNLAISTDEIRRRTDEQNLAATNALNRQETLLQAQLSIAESNDERKRIELQLLDAKYEELRLAKKAILDDTTGRYTDAQRKEAQKDIDALPGLKRAETTGVDQRYRGRYDQYRRDLSSADTLKDSIDGIKIQTLEAVTDELTNATKAALGLKGAFGDIVGELIKIGIQRRLIGPLADALFGKAGGAGGGDGSGGLLGSAINGFIQGIGGRASGGNVVAGKLYKINESGPELFSPSQSGKIYPTGAMKNVPGRAGNTTIVQQSFTLDARGGITTPELLQQVNVIASRKAAQAGQAAYQNSPARSARLSQLGT